MIEIRHLTKRYGSHTAVSDLDLTLQPGRIYGFLGPNGAGKSTTMNMMTGCLAPSEGTVIISGHDIIDDTLEAKKCIGYLPEIPPVYPDMTVREYLGFVASVRSIHGTERSKDLLRVMELTETRDAADRLIRHLSKGFRQRVGIAQALIGAPEFIILDEPTVGLDPAQIIEIRNLIRSLGQSHTVILSSHILPEVQACCDHIMIIDHGKLVASDSTENLEKLALNENRIVLTVMGEPRIIRETLLPLSEKASVIVGNTSDNSEVPVTIIPGNEEDDLRKDIFFLFASAGLPILEMGRHHASLEEIFLSLTGREFREPSEDGPAGTTGPARTDESEASL